MYYQLSLFSLSLAGLNYNKCMENISDHVVTEHKEVTKLHNAVYICYFWNIFLSIVLLLSYCEISILQNSYILSEWTAIKCQI